MTPFADWLAGVLARGESAQAAPPPTRSDADAVRLLEAAFRDHALDVGGPPLPFDPTAAGAAVLTLADGCWRVASGEADAPASRLGAPRSPAAHLSADVCLRFLPAVHQRTRARGPADPVAAWAEAVLRRWPLSGVLADLDGGPTTPPTFDGHPGLQLLYAERLADRPRAGWLPPDGPAREQVERVFRRLGRPVPVSGSPLPLGARGEG